MPSKKRILIVEDRAIFREPLAATLESRGYTVSRAENGQDALRTLELQLPDLVLLDLEMPKVDGLTVLSRIHAHPDWQYLPVIILTAHEGEKTFEQARELGADLFFSKSEFDLGLLVAAIKELFERREQALTDMAAKPVATAVVRGARDLVSDTSLPDPNALSVWSADASDKTVEDRPQLFERVDRERVTQRFTEIMGRVGSNPQHGELFELARPEGSTSEALLMLLRNRPGLGERVLAVANSPLFAASSERKTTTIDEALEQHGLPVLRAIAISIGIVDIFCPKEQPELDEVRFWEHSVAVSTFMLKLVHGADAETKEALYLTGLCHDLAEFLLRREFPQDFKRAEQIARDADLLLYEACESIFFISFAELSTMLLGDTHLPAAITRPILEQFDCPNGLEPVQKMSRPAQTLRLANYLAHGLCCVTSPDALIQPLSTEEYRRATGISIPPVIRADSLSADIRQTTQALLGIELADKRSTWSSLLVPRKDVSLWYARHSSFGRLDPISLALEALAPTKVYNRLPAHESDLGGHQAMVVSVPNRDIDGFTLFHCKHVTKELLDSGFRVLYMVGNELPPETEQEGIEVVQSPVSLADLAHFLEKL